MARKARSNYIEAALQILTELGGGPLTSKDLVKIAQERGLVGTTTYVYHNMLRKVRESSLFDTSVRGQVGLRPGAKTPDAIASVDEMVAPGTAPSAGAPAAVIREILSGDLPETNVLDTVEDEETNPNETQVDREF